jgi:hypothetical protein
MNFIISSSIGLQWLLIDLIMWFHRERRAELFAKWRAKGGVFLIGYANFRNLSLAKNMKDRHMAREICYALQVTVIDFLNSLQ